MIAAVALLYVLVLNIFVATPLLRSLVTTHLGRDLHIDYRRAYSLVPGRIHVDGLALRGSDSHVEWLLTIDTATFDWHPFAMRKRTFYASRVLASGVEFRIRLLESTADPPHDLNVPSIPGFENPPLKPIGPQTTVTDENYDLASVHLEGVDAEHVRLVWVDTLKVAGDAHLKARWEFRPLRRIGIGPAELAVAKLEVGVGDQAPFVTELSGRVEGTIEPYDIRQPVEEMIRHMSAHAKVTAALQASELGDIVTFPAEVPPPRGHGALSIDGGLERGVLSLGSKASLEVPDLVLRPFDVPVALALEAHGLVRPSATGASGSEATVDATLRHVSLGGGTTAETVSASFTSGTIDLSRPLTDLRYHALVPELIAPRLEPWSHFLPKGIAIAGGPAHVGGEVSGAVHGPMKTAVTVHSKRLMLTRAGTGSVTTDADLTLTATVDEGRAIGSATLTAEHARAHTKALDVTGDASVRAESWSVAWGGAFRASSGPVRLKLEDLDAFAPEGRSALAHVSEISLSSAGATLGGAGADGTVAFELKGGSVPDVARVFALLQTKALDLRHGAATAEARGDVDLRTKTASLGADVRIRRLELRAAGATVTGDIRLTLAARRLGSESLTYVGGTSIALDHVDGAGGSDWWARARIADGAVEWADDGLHGRLQLGVETRDAKPLDTFASTASGIPKWILGIFALPDLKARGELLFAPHVVALRQIQASGGSTTIQAEIEKTSSGSNGVVLAQHGPLEVGVGLGSEKPGVTLFGAGSWFRAHKLALDQRTLGWSGPSGPDDARTPPTPPR
jgi:hypothetical protein